MSGKQKIIYGLRNRSSKFESRDLSLQSHRAKKERPLKDHCETMCLFSKLYSSLVLFLPFY